MLDSNVPENLWAEICQLVPDADAHDAEFWRIVPNTQPGRTYSISSYRDIIVSHTWIDAANRLHKPALLTMSLDECTYNTSIRRVDNTFSTYVEHVRYDTFPELNIVKTLEDDLDDTVTCPYSGLQWFGRCKISVTCIPVTDADMQQIRQFYTKDLPREIWAYVPGTNRKYVISSQSRGVILKRYNALGTILKAQRWQLHSGDGRYYECCLTVGDHQLNSVAHAQILRSFIPKPGDEYEVNHIDGDTHNNILDNLEWVTRQENSDHYNRSPEMLSKRQEGYKKISEYGKAHQKEIQNRLEVNSKRSKTLKAQWTDERRKQQSKLSKAHWDNLSDDARASQVSGLMKHNEMMSQAAKERKNEDKKY